MSLSDIYQLGHIHELIVWSLEEVKELKKSCRGKHPVTSVESEKSKLQKVCPVSSLNMFGRLPRHVSQVLR